MVENMPLSGFKSVTVSEEALILAKYLRNERQKWIPRMPNLG